MNHHGPIRWTGMYIRVGHMTMSNDLHKAIAMFMRSQRYSSNDRREPMKTPSNVNEVADNREYRCSQSSRLSPINYNSVLPSALLANARMSFPYGREAHVSSLRQQYNQQPG
jgi:hypothetical protein